MKASHRKLDLSKTLSRPAYHSHDKHQPLEPGKADELDVETWPTNILLPKGAQLALQITGKDFEMLLPPLLGEPDAPLAMRPLSICTHNNAEDLPGKDFGGETTISPEEQISRTFYFL